MFYKAFSQLRFNLPYSRQSTSWPSVDGTLIRVEKIFQDQIGHTSNTEHGSYSLAQSRIYIEYRYNVEGKEYYGNRYSFSDQSNDDNPLWIHFNTLELNQNVRVYYHPNQHQLAVLYPGESKHRRILPIFGAVFLLVGLIFLPHAIKDLFAK